MSAIIKREGKYYRQQTTEQEVKLEELEAVLTKNLERKTEAIQKETQQWDDSIQTIRSEINQLKALK